MKTNAPCYGCERRNADCHSECDAYKEFAKQKAEENEFRQKMKIINRDWHRAKRNYGRKEQQR